MKRIVILLEEKWHAESLPDAAAAVRAFREYGFDADLWILGEQDKIPGDTGQEDVDDDGLAVRNAAELRPGGRLRVAGHCRDTDVPDFPLLPEHHHARYRRADGKIAA